MGVLADQGLTSTQILLTALGTIVVGMMTLAGVLFTAVRQGRTADKAAATEAQLQRFEEQDRMLVRERERADRADDRADAAEAKAALSDERAKAAEGREAEWRRKAMDAEAVIVKWGLNQEGL